MLHPETNNFSSENTTPEQDARRKFITAHAAEMKPVVSDPKTIDAITEGQDSDEEVMDKALEEFENKLFSLEKAESECEPDARRVLLSADNPGSYNVISALVRELEHDPRCKGISVVTGGFASREFAKAFGDRFAQVSNRDKPFLTDVDKTVSGEKPLDIMVGSYNTQNGPESIPLYSGKSVFGAKKVVYICDSWGGPGGAFTDTYKGSVYEDEGKRPAFSDIDAIICNDAFAKAAIRKHLPDFPEEKILPIGTPVLDSLEQDKGEEHRAACREKLGIPFEAFSVLYLGAVSNDYQSPTYANLHIDTRINEKTFERTVEEVVRYANEHPERTFALLIRLHPRDPSQQALLEITERLELPPNLIVRRADRSAVSINEAVYGADVVASIESTENYLAPHRGRHSVFLGYNDLGMGSAILEYNFGQSTPELSKQKGIHLVASPNELEGVFDAVKDEPIPIGSAKQSTSSKRISDVMFTSK